MDTALNISRLFFMLVGYFLCTPAYAGTYALGLHLNGKEFENIITNLKRGDIITFPDGARFEIAEYLGAGQNTRVYRLMSPPGRVIRLPQSYEKNILIDDFYYAAMQLADDGLPVLGVHDFLSHQYVVADLLDRDRITLEEYLRGNFYMTDAEEKELLAELRVFIKKSAMYSEIEDLHMDNLVYEPSKKRWIIMDVGGTVVNSERSLPTEPSIVKRLFDTSVYEIDDMGISATMMRGSFDHEQLARLEKEMHEAVAEARILHNASFRAPRSFQVPTHGACSLEDWEKIFKRKK